MQSNKQISSSGYTGLSANQRHVFNIAHKCAQDQVKSFSAKNKLKLQPFHIFLSSSGGSGGTGKSHVKQFIKHSPKHHIIRIILKK